MDSIRIFFWWFTIGVLMATAVIMIQGGLRDIMVAKEPLWGSGSGRDYDYDSRRRQF